VLKFPARHRDEQEKKPRKKSSGAFALQAVESIELSLVLQHIKETARFNSCFFVFIQLYIKIIKTIFNKNLDKM
jgi:hypothetical protein